MTSSVAMWQGVLGPCDDLKGRSYRLLTSAGCIRFFGDIFEPFCNKSFSANRCLWICLHSETNEFRLVIRFLFRDGSISLCHTNYISAKALGFAIFMRVENGAKKSIQYSH